MAQETSILKTAAADYDAVIQQMAALREEMAQMAHNLQTGATKRGNAMAKDVSDGMTEAATYLNRKGHEADMRVEHAVAANPYIALGLAAGLGLLVGVLTRR